MANQEFYINIPSNNSGGGVTNSFETMQTPAGTSPKANLPNDVLTFTSSDGSITITGNAITDTIDFVTTLGFIIKVSSNDTTAGYVEDKITTTDGSNITTILEATTLNDGANEVFQIQLDETKINHDALLNYVSNEHIDWTSTSNNFNTSGTLTVSGIVSLDNAVTINDSGADVDFRVEGNNDANLLFCDASTDRIGMGTATPVCELHLFTATGTICQRIESTDAAAGIMQLQLYNDSSKELSIGKLGSSVNFFGLGSGAILNRDGNFNIICDSNDPIIFYTDVGDTQNLSATEKMRLTAAGELGIGISPSNMLDIAKSGETIARLGSYSTTDSERSQLEFIKSSSATVGTGAVTVDTEKIGELTFIGHDTANAEGVAARMRVVQNGAASATEVPANIIFSTTNTTEGEVDRLGINSAGNTCILKSYAVGSLVPALCLDSTENIGWYSTGAGSRAFMIANGVTIIDYASSRVKYSIPLQNFAGAVSGTAFGFNSMNDGGLYLEDDSVRMATNGVVKQIWDDDGIVTNCPTVAVADALLFNSSVSLWLDETNDNLNFKIKDSGGSIQTAQINLNSAGIFAEINVYDASTAQSIPTGTTYTKITGFVNNGLSNRCTADVTNDKITITETGIYSIDSSFSFASGTANVIYKLAPFLDGTELDHIHIARKVSVAGDVGSASFTGFIDVTSVPVDLDVRIRHDNGGSVNFTPEYMNFNVKRIGDT